MAEIRMLQRRGAVLQVSQKVYMLMIRSRFQELAPKYSNGQQTRNSVAQYKYSCWKCSDQSQISMNSL